MSRAKTKIDPYATLGVDRKASDVDIRSAFRRSAKRAHPDQGGSAEEFAQVKTAQIVLLDPARRKKFDATGEIDDAQATNPDSAALGLISAALQNVIMQEPDPSSVDLVDAITAHFDREIGTLQTKNKPLKRAADRAKTLRAKFKRKSKGGINQIGNVLAHHLVQIEQAVAAHDEQIAAFKGAIELIADYDFEADTRQTHVTFFANFGPTTTGMR